MILITGATGNLGSSVVDRLQQILSKDEFIVSSSNVDGVSKLSNRSLNARLANFSDLTSLEKGFQGIEKLLLISTMDLNRFEQHKNVIDAAKQAGVKHIVYTSLAIKDIHTSGVKDLMVSHFQTEDYIKESGLTYTILRNTMYADALVQILGDKAGKQDIYLPGGNGKVPYVLRREMGEATANLLLQDGHENKVYDIVGSRAISYQEVAEELSEITGNTIQYYDVDLEEFKKKQQQFGFTEFAVYLHAGTLVDIKNHQYEIESSILEKLLGRPTASLTDFLKEFFPQQ